MLSILPKGKTQFFDRNGRILAGCSVYFYTPGTTTLKNTWQDAEGTILNTNPVILDASGSAAIWGNGSYRQVVTDQFGATIYDVESDAPVNQVDFDALSTSAGASKIGMQPSGTVQDAFNALYGAQGFGVIGRIATVDVLRSTEPSIATGRLVSVIEHTSGGGQGGGFFQYDASDTTTVDDNGWTIVTPNGARWKRQLEDNTVLLLADFGVLAGVTADTALTNALATAALANVTLIIWPRATQANPILLTGGLSFAYPVGGYVLRGAGETFNGTCISHTGNNTALTFTRGDDATLFSRVRIENIRVVGNAGSAANFAEFQDSWHCGMTSCWVSLYTFGAACVFHNVLQWTENPYVRDLMSRSNKYGILHLRTASSGGTASFYGADYQLAHQFAVANSAAVAMPSLSDATNYCNIYSAKIDIMGWYEGQGGHNAFLVGNYQQCLDSDVTVRTDGSGGIVNGTDMRAVNASGVNSLLDIYLRCNFQQGNYTDVSSLATGSNIGGFGEALSAANLFTTVNGRNIVRARGARYKWQLTSAADLVFTITNLPCYSAFRAILSNKGDNTERSSTFLIQTYGFNNLAQVVRLDTFTGAGGTYFNLGVFGGGSGGAFSTGNGAKIAWNHLAATFGVSVAVTLEIEML